MNKQDSDILHPQCHGSALPVTVRNLIRSNVFGTRSTAGVAGGYKQASIVILHQSLADDFEKFCHGNSGPLPLLYKSKIGEWDCPPLATDADIRTDCPLYNKYEFGEVTATLTNLMDYAEQLREMVTFYLGCSFSLEPLVLRAGVPIRNVEQGCNVSMFKTKVSCFTVGSFHCNLVVCMRPIPEDKLNAVTQITHPLHDLHGAPLHIGDPGLLGIENLSRPDYGDPVQPQPGDVPVFWACGVSGVEAVRSTKTAALAFTHSPGCMFITDLKSEKNDISPAIHLSETPCVFSVSKNPLHYSITSAESVQRIRRLEGLITADSGILKTPAQHMFYQHKDTDSALMFLCYEGNLHKPRFDCLIARGHFGMAADRNYYHKKKENIKHHVDPTDELFVAAQTIPGMTTTGFSDWGRYAVACALYILSSCEIHDRYLRKAVGFPRKTQMNNLASALPSVNKEEKLMEILTKHCEQIRKTGSLGMEVQSLSLHTLHYSMIQKLLEESLTKHLS